MAIFPSWNDWLALREDNARKRAVRAAFNGTGVPMAGSYAACPSTNPQAMDIAKKKGVVTKQPQILKIEAARKPDYSFDRWIQQAQELGDDVNKLVGHGKEDEEKLDKSKKDQEEKAKKQPVEKPVEKEPAEKEPVEKEDPKKAKIDVKPEIKPTPKVQPKLPKQPPKKPVAPKKPVEDGHEDTWKKLKKIHKDWSKGNKKPEDE